MPTVRSGPEIGLVAQITLLVILASTVGLGVAGWLAGLAYGAVTCAALLWGLRRSGASDLGPADRVTAARGVLVGGVTALTADSFDRPAPLALLVTLTVVALALDAVDGAVARRTGTASALGARFDMEVDSALVLVLSVLVAPVVGGWMLAIGAMRYVFVAASWVLPWMRGSLPPRYWRKVVAAVQGVTLVVAAADVLPRPVVVAAGLGSLALLVESFGRDVRWLWRHRSVAPDRARQVEPAPRSAVAAPPGIDSAAQGSGPTSHETDPAPLVGVSVAGPGAGPTVPLPRNGRWRARAGGGRQPEVRAAAGPVQDEAPRSPTRQPI